MRAFAKRFGSMTKSTLRCLNSCGIAVMAVLVHLSSVTGVDDRHNGFLKENIDRLYQCENFHKLFILLNSYWSPLSFDLLGGLLKNLAVKYKEFKQINREFKQYKKDMKYFMDHTSLAEFCDVTQGMLSKPPEGFNSMVFKHKWHGTVTLKNVEEFRKRFFCEIALSKCAMLVNIALEEEKVKVTWASDVQISDFKMLRMRKDTITLFDEYNVDSVDINGRSVYQSSNRRAFAAESQVNLNMCHFLHFRVLKSLT